MATIMCGNGWNDARGTVPFACNARREDTWRDNDCARRFDSERTTVPRGRCNRGGGGGGDEQEPPGGGHHWIGATMMMMMMGPWPVKGRARLPPSSLRPCRCISYPLFTYPKTSHNIIAATTTPTHCTSWVNAGNWIAVRADVKPPPLKRKPPQRDSQPFCASPWPDCNARWKKNKPQRHNDSGHNHHPRRVANMPGWICCWRRREMVDRAK
mmetsp:Transcript_26870/g.62967  ORF Transcript_26870/g.62967 Transcript_26870/m.62967 type:complete len:212 (+) Transcript_26870:171-806(+)